MSIDLDICPTTREIASWGAIKKFFLEKVTRELEILDEQVFLLQLGTNRTIDEDESLELNNSYYLSLKIKNTLIVNVTPNKDILNEFEYLEDYGRNLSLEAIQALADSWRSAGHSYEITSMAGRSTNESKLMVYLTTAIACVCGGHIIVMDDNFDLGVGVYSPDQFQGAKPNF